MRCEIKGTYMIIVMKEGIILRINKWIEGIMRLMLVVKEGKECVGNMNDAQRKGYIEHRFVS